MAIPESQLETWSSQGSITQSSATYNTIKNALEAAGSAYTGRDYSVFLQGSYGNNTNIYAESDVDIIIRLNSCFHHDTDALSAEQKAAFAQKYCTDADYRYADFKNEVLAWLLDMYEDAIEPGDKAIKIAANGSRRNADVIVATGFRRYYSFQPPSTEAYHAGICFFDANNGRIANYPKQHSENCTSKHQDTNKWFKPTVRVLKNLRSKLVDEKMIEPGLAPSYYIEGLLYNVPPEKFGQSHGATFANSINWILEADRSKFLCANERYYLLREDSAVTWRESKCAAFLAAACELWNQW
jgi:hypothetical protein